MKSKFFDKFVADKISNMLNDNNNPDTKEVSPIRPSIEFIPIEDIPELDDEEVQKKEVKAYTTNFQKKSNVICV